MAEPFSGKRTLYAFIDRQNLPGDFRTFDFANPDLSNQGRFRTTVPQQALFLMNSPFVIAQARALTERARVKTCPAAEEKLASLTRLALQREPTKAELRGGTDFVRNVAIGGSTFSAWELYAQVLLLSNELMFVD